MSRIFGAICGFILGSVENSEFPVGIKIFQFG